VTGIVTQLITLHWHNDCGIFPVVQRLCSRLLMVIFIGASIRARAEPPSAAERQIPFAELSVTDSMLVHGVTDHYTLRREYATRSTEVDALSFVYLLDHPYECAVLAQHCGLIKIRLRIDDDGAIVLRGANGESHGRFVRILMTPSKRIYYFNGSTTGAIKAEGRGVAVLNFSLPWAGQIDYSGALFVKVDNARLNFLAQTFGIFLRRNLDRSYHEVIRTPLTLSVRALQDRDALLEKIDEMTAVDRVLMAEYVALLRSSEKSLAASVPEH
jgi:hypothetical protein